MWYPPTALSLLLNLEPAALPAPYATTYGFTVEVNSATEQKELCPEGDSVGFQVQKWYGKEAKSLKDKYPQANSCSRSAAVVTFLLGIPVAESKLQSLA